MCLCQRFIIILMLLPVAASAASDSLMEKKQSKEAEAKIASLRAAIDREAAQFGEEHWAGNYYEGDGMGANISLAIAPKAGFAYEWHGCLGLYDRNYGPVTDRDGVLLLESMLPNEEKGFRISDQLIPVRWGKRHYLIRPDKMLDFCNEVNTGSEPRKGVHGMALLKRGDEKIDVNGLPEIPAAYRKHLRTEPLKGKITEVHGATSRTFGEYTRYEYPCVIDVGEDDGVFEGMVFKVDDPTTHTLARARVIEVRKKTATVVVDVSVPRDGKPKPGWVLDSKMYATPRRF